MLKIIDTPEFWAAVILGIANIGFYQFIPADRIAHLTAQASTIIERFA